MATEVILKNVRFGYLKVFEGAGRNAPQAPNKFGNPGYSLVALMPKDGDAHKAISAAVDAEKIAAFKSLSGAKKAGVNDPVQDGDEKDEDGYAGMVYVNVNGKLEDQVMVVGPDNKQASGENWGAGDYGVLAANVFCTTKYNKVGLGLIGLQFLKKGETMARTRSPDKYFQVEAVEPAEDF